MIGMVGFCFETWTNKTFYIVLRISVIRYRGHLWLGDQMKMRIHRDQLMFKWITKDHEIIIGFKHVRHGKCSVCGKRVPMGNTICDECFEKDKKISKR